MYFTNGISLLVAASALMLPSIIQKGKKVLLIPIVVTILVFIIQGSRFRLVILVCSLASVYYLYTKKKIKPLFWAIFAVAFFIFMGIIELTRNYSRGLDLAKLQGRNISDYASNAENEAKVFFFSGAGYKLC